MAGKLLAFFNWLRGSVLVEGSEGSEGRSRGTSRTPRQVGRTGKRKHPTLKTQPSKRIIRKPNRFQLGALPPLSSSMSVFGREWKRGILAAVMGVDGSGAPPCYEGTVTITPSLRTRHPLQHPRHLNNVTPRMLMIPLSYKIIEVSNLLLLLIPTSSGFHPP